MIASKLFLVSAVIATTSALSFKTATVRIDLVFGTAFTAHASGTNALSGNTTECGEVAVGGECVLENLPLNEKFTITFHCIPNTVIDYVPRVAGNITMRVWGSCWWPHFSTDPDNSTTELVREKRIQRRQPSTTAAAKIFVKHVIYPTATVSIELAFGTAFTAHARGINALSGNTTECGETAVGGTCVLEDLPLNEKFTVTHHCLPNTVIDYMPVIGGNITLRTWGTCWSPQFSSEPENAITKVVTIRQESAQSIPSIWPGRVGRFRVKRSS